MVIVTVVTKENPHTVYFHQPIQKPSYIRLLSCSLYNSWFNLKKKGAITFFDNDEKPFEVDIYPGHYTLDTLTKEIKFVLSKHRVALAMDINTSFGKLIILILKRLFLIPI